VALDANDQPAVQQHCRNLQACLQTSDEPCPLPIAKKILAGLRRKRHFDAMQHVADALLQNGQDDPLVSRQYAQALIDRGLLALAIQYLNVLLPEVESNPDEEAEVLGLLGRAYKQLFVESQGKIARAAEYLGMAIDYYMQVYSNDASNVWHGINATALLTCRSIPMTPRTCGMASMPLRCWPARAGRQSPCLARTGHGIRRQRSPQPFSRK
jgi:tetratricopeptide (TPR) repeat protein